MTKGLELVREWLQAENEEIALTGKDFAHNVHLARAQTKRLAASLRLLRPCIISRSNALLKGRIKSAAELLADLRDAHVLRKTLLRTASEAGGKAALKSWIEANVPQCGLSSGLVKLRRSRNTLAGVVEDWPCPREMPALTRLVESGVRETLARAKKSFRRAERKRGVEEFHACRKWSKCLFLQLTLAEAAAVRSHHKATKRFDRLQKELGQIHDLAVAEGFLATHSERESRMLAAARRELFTRREALEKMILKRGRKLLWNCVL